MKILVHDYSGHAFPVQLSRWLAAQGNQVLHLYSADIESPRGNLSLSEGDPDGFAVTGLSVGRPLDKYNLLRRLADERAYGRLFADAIHDFHADVVLCSNTPPAIVKQAVRAAKATSARFVVWVQDLYSKAFDSYVRKRLGPLGRPASWYVRRVELGAIASSDAIVVISDGFLPLLEAGGIARSRVEVIENWAPLNEVVPKPRGNDWAKEQGLTDKFVFLYSGTLGLKHNPALLSRLAERFRGDAGVRVVVVSQGLGRKFLEEEKAAKGLSNLVLLDYVRFDRLPEVLGSADILVTILEPEAGVLSVPSKVLSYLCAGRSILGAIPSENLAARTILRAKAGAVADPRDMAAFIEAAVALHDDVEGRDAQGRSALAYANENFDIDRIGLRFIRIFQAGTS